MSRFVRTARVLRREDGFTLIELLIVMLVLGNLAAIALPAFYNQRTKANDTKAKLTAHTAQVAMETCAVSNLGLYTSCGLTALRAIDSTLPSTGIEIINTGGGYTIKVTATSENTYSVAHSATGAISFPCTVASASNRGGCPGAAAAAGTWG